MTRLIRGLLFACLVVAVALPAVAQGNKNTENQPRSIEGQVHDQNEGALSNAVVYLKNTRTLAVRSYISGQDGSYHFSGLSQNVDYEVHAEFNGAKSDTKTLSGFDSRPKSVINLKIPIKK